MGDTWGYPRSMLYSKKKTPSTIYPLVICYIAMERSTMLFMGKSTISMAIFNSYFDIARGYKWWGLAMGTTFAGRNDLLRFGPFELAWEPLPARWLDFKTSLDWVPPFGNWHSYWTWPIDICFTYQGWWFSIAMLVYQRLFFNEFGDLRNNLRVSIFSIAIV